MKAVQMKFGLLVVSVFIFGCSSPEVRSEKPRTVAQSLAVQDAQSSSTPYSRKYQESLNCKLMEQPLTNSYEREKVSALTGFAVGPGSAVYAADLSKPILRPFSSDGCSSSPDGVPLTENSSIWVDCCIRHDTSYWMGGTKNDKKKADEDLKSCIAGKGYPNVAKVYKSFVREFGGPNSTQSYRWGYGWNYKRSFSVLKEEEVEQIKRLYGVDKNQFSDFMMERPFSLQRVCDHFDPVFYGLKKEEIETYHFLNARLKRQDVITWARLKSFNQSSYSYEIKLESCDEAIVVTLFEEKGKVSEIKSSCDL